MPAYKISNTATRKTHLVIADTPSQAVRYVANQLLLVSTLRGQEVAELVASGVRVEDARTAQKEIDLKLAPETAAKSEYSPLTDPGDFPAAEVEAAQRSNGGTPSAEVYYHKAACPADPFVPIGGDSCRCTKLELEGSHADAEG